MILRLKSEALRPHKIDRLGNDGCGIAAGPVYVAGALPGEIVTGPLNGVSLDRPRVLSPSRDRVAPLCPHYDSCGGCALQHAQDDFIAAWKQDVVWQALQSHGIAADVLPPLTSPPGSRRRAVFTGRRTKNGAIVGFHAKRSHVLVSIPHCRVLHPKIRAVLPMLEKITRLAATRTSRVRFHIFLGDTGLDLAITGAKPLDRALRITMARFGSSFARITWEGELIFMSSAPGVTFGSTRVIPPPGAFLQATEAGEAALVQAALDGTKPAQNVVDFFAGCGTFTFPIASQAKVHAVEGDVALYEALLRAARHTKELKKITAERRDLFRTPFSVKELGKFDAAIIDPPRAGAEAQMQMLAQAHLPYITALSCNPITFARDIAILTSAGYRLGPVQLIDQFRWSPHIEIAVHLSLE